MIQASRERERVKKATDSPERPKGKIPKKRRSNKITSQGVARYCSLYKANSAPDYLFNSHSNTNCFKKNGEKKMSGRAAERDSATKVNDWLVELSAYKLRHGHCNARKNPSSQYKSLGQKCSNIYKKARLHTIHYHMIRLGF